MRILALCKYSFDVAEIRIDSSTRELRLASVPRRVGGVDKSAVEAAVRLREADGGEVHVLCLGPMEARDAFRDVLAMGADDVTIAEDPFDGLAEGEVAALILEAAIRRFEPFDLVLCGFASDDGYTFQLGPRLAERLALPFVSYARQISVSDGTLTVERDLEDQTQIVSVRLPTVVSIAEEAFPPRRTTLMDALRARQKPVTIWQLDAPLGLTSEALDCAKHRLSVTSEGILVKRKRRVLAGPSLPDLADQLIQGLLEERVLTEGVS